MTDNEVARLAAAGATAGLCPVTEASLGDGLFQAPAWFAAQGRIAIGTDSNVVISVPAELRQLEYAQRLHTRRRNVLAAGLGASTGATLYAAAAGGGAALAAPPHALPPAPPPTSSPSTPTPPASTPPPTPPASMPGSSPAPAPPSPTSGSPAPTSSPTAATTLPTTSAPPTAPASAA